MLKIILDIRIILNLALPFVTMHYIPNINPHMLQGLLCVLDLNMWRVLHESPYKDAKGKKREDRVQSTLLVNHFVWIDHQAALFGCGYYWHWGLVFAYFHRSHLRTGAFKTVVHRLRCVLYVCAVVLHWWLGMRSFVCIFGMASHISDCPSRYNTYGRTAAPLRLFRGVSAPQFYIRTCGCVTIYCHNLHQWMLQVFSRTHSLIDWYWWPACTETS